MALIKTPKYLRSVKKIVSSHKLTQKIIDDTEIVKGSGDANAILI